jgi:hypothetical protein
MFSKRNWIIPTAFTMLFLILAAEFGLRILVLPAVGCFGWTVFALWRDFGPRDPYDLTALKQLHEDEELAALDPDFESVVFDSFLCPHCDTIYSNDFPICPKCRQPR